MIILEIRRMNLFRVRAVSSQQWGFTAGGNIHTLQGLTAQHVLTCLHQDQVSKVEESFGAGKRQTMKWV